MKRILVLSLLILVVSRDAVSWSWDAHHFITDHAISILPYEERKVFEGMKEKILEASILPDKLREEGKDFEENHIYNPKTGKGAAPVVMVTYYGKLVSDLSEKRMENASEDAGMLAHYTQDISMPLHTGEYVEEHGSIEAYINETLTRTFIFSSEKDIVYVSDPSSFAKEIGKESFLDYEVMIESYKNNDSKKLDTLSEKHINRAVIATASLFHSALKDSGYLGGEKGKIGIFQKIMDSVFYYLIVLRKPLTILALILVLFFYVRGRKK